jgi:hypothetical protein
MGYQFGPQFDRAITSSDGRYTLLYTNLGTKGLLLKKPNEVLREINRSYYCAETYEYPAAFFTIAGRTFLAHCPTEYCRLDFEDVETGEIITSRPDRKPQDFFHSRLEFSPDGKYLISKGWIWHPLDIIAFFNIPDCLTNPPLLDAAIDNTIERKTEDDTQELEYGANFEFCTSSFLNDRLLVAVPSHANHSLSFWDMAEKKIVRKLETEQQLGNLLAIDENWAWDLFQYPKLIDLRTGNTEWQEKNINSGEQNSSIIISQELPPIAWNREMRKLAIGGENKVDVLGLL